MSSSCTVLSWYCLGPHRIQPRRRGLGGGNTISTGAAAPDPAWETAWGPLKSHLGLFRDDVDGVRILVMDLGVDRLLRILLATSTSWILKTFK
jgi:hypothetical protein